MRADVFCKYRFFSEKALGMETAFARKFYLEHIRQRNNFVEAPDKSKPKDFLRAADRLFRSMKKNGFDLQHPIPISNGQLLGGAHRLACALALGIPPVFEEKEGIATPWNFSWFRNFNKRSRMSLLHSYSKLNPVSIFCLWGEFEDDWSRMSAVIQSRMKLVGSFLIETRNMAELVRDIYINQTKGIEKKALEARPRLKVVVCEQDHATAREVKEDLRRRGKNVCHSSDDDAESQHLADTLCSWHNIQLLGKRRNLPKEFCDRIKGCSGTVVGSAALFPFGGKKPRDVDIIGQQEGFDSINRPNYRKSYTNLQIIEHPDLHHFIRGVKFCNPDIVKERKSALRKV